MKKYKIILGLFCFTYFSYGQTGIGSRNPHSSAILDMDVSALPANAKKGFLLNRVSLTGTNDITTIANPIAGLMIYNTATTIGANAVVANNIYIWNSDLQRWERYFSRDEISEFIIPSNFYIRSLTDQIISSLASFNTGTAVSVMWQPSDLVVANADIVVLDTNNISFTIEKSGVYDITGFFNYNPQLSENSSTRTTTSNQTDVVFQLQRSVNGGSSWTTVNAVTTTIGRGIGNTFTSTSFPSTTVRLNEGDKLSFSVSRNIGVNRINHNNNAGITSASGQAKKSVRISYVAGL